MQEIIINQQTAGGRLDKTVMKYLDKAPSSFVYKMLRKKNIVINDKKAKGDEILKPGDSVKLYLADDTISKFRSPDKKKTVNKAKTTAKVNVDSFRKMIVFEDDNLLAVYKPQGLLSQKSVPSDVSVNDMLTAYLGESLMFTPGISNRLDRNTSGIMVAGKNPQAVRLLNAAIKERTITKLYLCLVAGKVSVDSLIEGYLVKDPVSNKVTVYKNKPVEDENAAYIKTAYQVISSNDNTSLLMVDLITGRSHQIRAHLASIGHPIIGDVKYGNTRVNLLYKDKYHLNGQLLHAYKLCFNEMTGILEYLNGKEIECSPPPVFNRAIKGENLCLHGHQGD